MKLLDLPTEFVERTVRLAIPFRVDTIIHYRERQNTLLSLCLVNSYLRQIAQPVLQEVTWALPGARVRQWDPLTKRPSKGNRDLAVFRAPPISSWSDVAPFLLQCAALRSLRFDYLDVDIAALECFSSTFRFSTSLILRLTLFHRPALFAP